MQHKTYHVTPLAQNLPVPWVSHWGSPKSLPWSLRPYGIQSFDSCDLNFYSSTCWSLYLANLAPLLFLEHIRHIHSYLRTFVLAGASAQSSLLPDCPWHLVSPLSSLCSNATSQKGLPLSPYFKLPHKTKRERGKLRNRLLAIENKLMASRGEVSGEMGEIGDGDQGVYLCDEHWVLYGSV